jgi:nitronate monooxygenase
LIVSNKQSLSWPANALTAALGIRYPIVQGPLNGLEHQRLVAAVSNFGGLGSFGAHGLTPEAIRRTIAEIRAMTAKPFAVNLWVSMQDSGAVTSDEAAFSRSLAALSEALQSLHAPLPSFKPFVPLRFEDQVRILLEQQVPAFSFICGIPAADILSECRRRSIRTMGTATTVEEARALEAAGIDIIVASGFEAGGHRGSFLRPAEESLTGTFSLVPQIVDAVKAPVVAAGGVADARGLVAALVLGAQGVQLGTAFLASEESGSYPSHRDAIRNGAAGHTVLTKNLTGRWARGIENELTALLSRAGVEALPYPLQRALVRSLTAAAEKANKSEWMQMWAGQSASMSRGADPIEFLQKLVSTSTAMIEG